MQDLDRRLSDQPGRDAVAAELAHVALPAAAQLATAIVESKRRTKLSETSSGPPRWATIKSAMRERLSSLAPSDDERSVGALVAALWTMDRTPPSIVAICDAAFAVPAARGVLPVEYDRFTKMPTAPVIRVLDQAIRIAPPDVLAERLEVLLPWLRCLDLLEAANALASQPWGDREYGRIADVVSRSQPIIALFDGAQLLPEVDWLFGAMLVTTRRGEGREVLERWLARVAPQGPRLPYRLPTELDELRSFAALFGATFDEGDPARIVVDYGSTLEQTLAMHLEFGDQVTFSERELDVRSCLPFDAVAVLGVDSTGDTLFVDPRLRTRDGTSPVLRYCHDKLFTVELEANSEYELAARKMLSSWATEHARLSRPDVHALLKTPVVLAMSPRDANARE